MNIAELRDKLRHAYAVDAGEFAEPQREPRLPPFFGHEAPFRDSEVDRQRQALREWIDRNCCMALARKTIAKRYAAALAAEGLD